MRIADALCDGSDMAALAAAADREQLADHLLIGCTAGDALSADDHYLAGAEVIELLEASSFVVWRDDKPRADTESIGAARAGDVPWEVTDTLGLRSLGPLSRNKLPWSMRVAGVGGVADDWFERVFFRVATAGCGLHGRRFGSAELTRVDADRRQATRRRVDADHHEPPVAAVRHAEHSPDDLRAERTRVRARTLELDVELLPSRDDIVQARPRHSLILRRRRAPARRVTVQRIDRPTAQYRLRVDAHRADVVVLCALPVEFRAVRRHLRKLREVAHPAGTVYELGVLHGRPAPTIALVEVGQGNPAAASACERAVTFFKPSIALFVGIAGGLKDADLGDVVIAERVLAYEAGKDAGQYQPRIRSHHSTSRLVEQARSVARTARWTRRVSEPPQPVPHALVAPIAAGEKVLASERSRLRKLLARHCSDAVAVEMEGFGFLHAAWTNPDVAALVVRGISDLLAKSASGDRQWQPVAAAHAAAFAVELLTRLDFDAPAGSLPVSDVGDRLDALSQPVEALFGPLGSCGEIGYQGRDWQVMELTVGDDKLDIFVDQLLDHGSSGDPIDEATRNRIDEHIRALPVHGALLVTERPIAVGEPLGASGRVCRWTVTGSDYVGIGTQVVVAVQREPATYRSELLIARDDLRDRLLEQRAPRSSPQPRPASGPDPTRASLPAATMVSSPVMQWRPTASSGAHPIDLTIASIVQVPAGRGLVSFPDRGLATMIRGEERETEIARILSGSPLSEWLARAAPSFGLTWDGHWTVTGYNAGDWSELAAELSPRSTQPSPVSIACRAQTAWVAGEKTARGVVLNTEIGFRLLELDANRQPSSIRYETMPPPAPAALSLEELADGLAAAASSANTAVELAVALTSTEPDNGSASLWVFSSHAALDRTVDLTAFRVIPGSSVVSEHVIRLSLAGRGASDLLIDPATARGAAVDLITEALERSGMRGTTSRLEALRSG